MVKTGKSIVLTASLLTWLTPALADDAKQIGGGTVGAPIQERHSAIEPEKQAAYTPNPRRIDHPHYPSDWIPSRHIILSAKGLTDQQKNDIQAVYDDSAARFAALDLEYHDLRKSNWEKIENILTKEQADEVMTDQNNLTHPNNPLPADVHTSPIKRVKKDAATNQ